MGIAPTTRTENNSQLKKVTTLSIPLPGTTKEAGYRYHDNLLTFDILPGGSRLWQCGCDTVAPAPADREAAQPSAAVQFSVSR